MLTAGESSELERLGLEGEDVEIDTAGEDVEEVMPEPSNDLNEPDAPYASADLQAKIESLPFAIALRKTLAKELGSLRVELRSRLRDIKVCRAGLTAAREELETLRSDHAATRAEHAALRAEMRLEQLLSEEPSMTAARRQFVRALYKATPPPSGEIEQWFTATMSTITKKGQ